MSDKALLVLLGLCGAALGLVLLLVPDPTGPSGGAAILGIGCLVAGLVVVGLGITATAEGVMPSAEMGGLGVIAVAVGGTMLTVGLSDEATPYIAGGGALLFLGAVLLLAALTGRAVRN